MILIQQYCHSNCIRKVNFSFIKGLLKVFQALSLLDLYFRTSTMSSQRSSVRPPKPKMPWGTILKPEFGMGHQKMTDYEIEQTVDRLYKIKEYKERYYERTGKKMSDDEISEMVRIKHLLKYFCSFRLLKKIFPYEAQILYKIYCI